MFSNLFLYLFFPLDVSFPRRKQGLKYGVGSCLVYFFLCTSMLFQYSSQNECQLDFIVIVRKRVCVIGDDESDVLGATVKNSRLIGD